MINERNTRCKCVIGQNMSSVIVCVDGFVKVDINTEEHMVTILCAFLVPQIKFLELNCLC